MKKKIILIILAIIILIVSATIVYGVNNARNRKSLSWIDEPWDSFDAIVDRLGTPQGSKSNLDIPVYYEEDLLFDLNGGFSLNRDASFYHGLNAIPNESSAILAAYPTNAIRTRTDNTAYAVYDTDSGYRFYLFFSNDGGISTTIGFPIVIKNMLSYSNFKDIKVGDFITEVEEIDDVATLHKKVIVDAWDLNAKGAATLAEMGHPCTSIHYLKDGILKIEYTMLDNQSLVVSNIVFNENYQLTNALGETINHKIEDIDLPKN